MYDGWFVWSLLWLIPFAALLWLIFSWSAGRSSARWGREAGPEDRYRGFGGTLGYRRMPRRFRGRGPRNYARSDARIEEDVNDRLLMEDEIDPSDVEVRVQDGVVTLLGHVGSRADKVLAESITDSVAGVRDVKNQLEIATGTLPPRTRTPEPELGKSRA